MAEEEVAVTAPEASTADAAEVESTAEEVTVTAPEASTIDNAEVDSPAAVLLKKYGWDKGWVLFGMPASEATVRVLTALELLKTQGSQEYSLVNLTFDSKNINKKGTAMGVASEDWKVLSQGRSYMPALARDGKLQFEAGEIVKSLATEFPDESLSAEENAEVLRLLDLANDKSGRCLEALKHWGWQAFQGNKPNYKDFGYGNKKDLEWERATVAHVDGFLRELDAHMATKAGSKTHFVGEKLTYADCSLINWVWSFKFILCLEVAKRYPNLMAQAKLIKSEGVPGSEQFLKMFPIFSRVVGVCNWRNRGMLFGRNFKIENKKYWTTEETKKEEVAAGKGDDEEKVAAAPPAAEAGGQV